jgi:hypothetical protein
VSDGSLAEENTNFQRLEVEETESAQDTQQGPVVLLFGVAFNFGIRVFVRFGLESCVNTFFIPQDREWLIFLDKISEP